MYLSGFVGQYFVGHLKFVPSRYQSFSPTLQLDECWWREKDVAELPSLWDPASVELDLAKLSRMAAAASC